MSLERIAIVGIGLRYPDAGTPGELWENVLAGRRAFRRLPDERMSHADYFSTDPSAPDRFYTSKAAVLRDFEFDRVHYRVAGSTYRATDLTHWLALDVAAMALADAGFPDGAGLPGRTTGVVIGNSLTGEFTRAHLMRLRWPYVRRTVAAALTAKGWGSLETSEFLAGLEQQYKAPFPPIGEDSLAGGLSNTIAGRICNHFDLGGGGYTVDGACSSSLLSVATAVRALADGDLDVALAGGVDLSIDPFEVIGFAKTGALATGEMKVYDRDSNGFWPGEGCGMLVLMREADAISRGARIYASIAGWGISSDGKGSITRPAAEGHRLALARAYSRAAYGVETVSYFEGHGTGTALGDATEISALSDARRDADPAARPAALGTIKGNIGHTKAAAGVAGLIKATLAVHHQVIPPGTGQRDPHPLLADGDAVMYVPAQAELWPADQPVRAGVSAMGFGGINTHIAVELPPGVPRRETMDAVTVTQVHGRQDAELLLLDADDIAGLKARARSLVDFVPTLSFAELADLAGALAGRLTGARIRAALVVSSPADAARKLARLLEPADTAEFFSVTEGIFLSASQSAPTIAFLFPGQGSGSGGRGAIRRRFPAAEEIFLTAGVPAGGDQVATEIAQPRIVAGSLAASAVLADLGIRAAVAVGHSLGELTALHWGGAMDSAQVLDLTAIRGRVMAGHSLAGGAMASLDVAADHAERITAGAGVVIAGYNSPGQTVVSGPVDAVERVCELARSEGVSAVRLNVSHAFHSPLVSPAAEAMAGHLAEVGFQRLRQPVLSTVTGELLDPDIDLRVLLRDQIVQPVRFAAAAAKAAKVADLAIEVGPGRVLSGLFAAVAPGMPVLSTQTDSDSLAGLLRVVGAAFALGAPVRTEALFAGRVIRPLPIDGKMSFLTNPCEAAPTVDIAHSETRPADDATRTVREPADEDASTLQLLRKLAAERVELPLEAVTSDTYPLDDLHLSSITVGQIVNEVTRELGRPVLQATPNFATVRIGELADMIDQLADTEAEGTQAAGEAPGVAQWVRPFSVDYVEQALTVTSVTTVTGASAGEWTVYAPAAHPLAEPLRVALASAGIGDGVLLCLPEHGSDHVDLFLEAGRKAIAVGGRFVVVQKRFGAAGLARTVHLEAPAVLTTVVGLTNITPTDPDMLRSAVECVVAEATATTNYAEARYDETGTRTVPTLRAIVPPAEVPAGSPLTPEDVLLVIGGGKGITAECALAMAKDSGAKLALLGRADPEHDTQLAANLSRMDAAGVRVRYERADVTSPEQVKAAVGKLVMDLGPVTVVLHGAGRNEPAALERLTSEAFHQALAPKVAGLRAVLSAVDESEIKLLITFGSIIGRAGLRGEAHYACANDWLTELTVQFQREHPRARALALEWSVWSGAGMGERLGVVEALTREGITPISIDNGISVLRHVLANPCVGPVIVVSGRTGALPTIARPRRELPLLRFADRVLVDYPGIELVTEADLSPGGDLYLADHQLDGDLLFPAVLGMEAMAQVAAVVSGQDGPPLLTGVEFLRPITARPSGTTIRLAALLTRPGVVDVVVRSDETGFGADHFRATLRFPRPAPPDSELTAELTLPAVPVDPVTDLYGGILFQGKRFQRLLAYRQAGARRAVAEIATGPQAAWFAAFLPQQLLLADPGARDAAMHAIQCCVPDATLLPQRIERLYLADPAEQDPGYVILDAREQSQDGDSYTYDVDLRARSGALVERWEGLTLRAVRKRDAAGPWVPAMLGAYLERTLEKVLGGSRAVVVEPDPVPGGQPAVRCRCPTARTVSRRPIRWTCPPRTVRD
jgi:enediyne polyketide synthase